MGGGEYTAAADIPLLQYISIKYLALGKIYTQYFPFSYISLDMDMIVYFLSHVLAALVLQNTFLVVLMRLSRTYKDGPLYASR